MREMRRLHIGARLETHLVEHGEGGPGQRRIVPRRGPEAEAVPVMRLHRERDIVERGEFLEDAGDLERSGEALERRVVRRHR